MQTCTGPHLDESPFKSASESRRRLVAKSSMFKPSPLNIHCSSFGGGHEQKNAKRDTGIKAMLTGQASFFCMIILSFVVSMSHFTIVHSSSTGELS